MKTFKIEIPIYGCKVLCIFGKAKYARKILKKEISKRKLKNWDFKDCDGLTLMYNSGLAIMWLRNLPDTPEAKGTLAHEINHILNFICLHVGLTRDNNGEEAQCYLVGNITQQVYKNLV